MATRDYSKKRKPAPKPLPHKGFLLGSAFGLTVGLSVAIVVYAYYSPPQDLRIPAQTLESPQSPQPDSSSDTLPGSDFTFYDTLPSFSVSPGDEKNKALESAHYILEAHAFSEEDLAKQFQEKLAKSGYQANIKKEQGKGKLVYRIWFGPYPEEQRNAAMAALKRQGISVLAREYRTPQGRP